MRRPALTSARLVAGTATAVLTATMVAAPSTAAPRTVTSVAAAASAGAPGAGDPYFPLSGNGGFHVIHYGLDLAYTGDESPGGSATIQARSTMTLNRFDLDFSGLTISGLTVNGKHAAYTRRGQELVITPAAVLWAGTQFTVRVTYHGVPHYVTDPDGSPDGWIATDTGAFVGSEPQGAMTWFPASSHPIDKSAYDVTMKVPAGYLAVGNGDLVSQRRTKTSTTTHWRETQPMAAYLATASIAKFQTQEYRVGKIAAFVAVDPREAAAAKPALAKLPAIVKWESATFGPYPFTSTGAIVTRAPGVGYALETQTRPLFDQAPDTETLVHELAHQWFGDSVSVTKWQDIWLNEGFATYAQWLWSEHNGGPSARQRFLNAYAAPPTAGVWALPVAYPHSGAHIFGSPSYQRGAMVLEKLREKVGTATFLTVLRTWAADHRHGHGTTPEFTALATKLSGEDLKPLFHTWLYTAGKPAHG